MYAESRDFAHAVKRRNRTARAKAHDSPRQTTLVCAIRLCPPYARASRRHDDLAEHLAILDQAQALGGLVERQHLVDHRLHLALGDERHQPLEIVVIEAVGADDLQLESPHVTKVLLGIVAGGRAAYEQLAAALEAAQRRLPGIAAREVDDHV